MHYDYNREWKNTQSKLCYTVIVTNTSTATPCDIKIYMQQLGVPTFKDRRMTVDMIQVCKILHGFDDIHYTSFS